VEAPGLAEGEYVSLDAGCEEGDLECAVGDRGPLANQLMELRLGQRAAALLVDVEPVSVAMTGWRRRPNKLTLLLL
jgi:hypothetical protein